MSTKIAVIGGGLGGITAALSLLREGFDVHVYEQAGSVREVGAGIQISPNAARVLYHLGFAEAMTKLGVRPLTFHQRRWQDGQTLLEAPLGDAVVEKFGFPYYHFHRADLLQMLIDAFPPERLHAGHRLTGFIERNERIEAEFENGTKIGVDALIGADGIHSTVRRMLFGPEHPRFTGCVAYRGLIPAERIEHLKVDVSTQVWMGPDKHIVTYFVAGQRYLNFVGVVEQDSWTAESWNTRGDVGELRMAFADWDPKLRAIIAAFDETFVWGLFDRMPLPQWTRGRAALLGDACHPMLPFMAQGAAQAIEDGACLARCLKLASSVTEGFSRFESLRRPRTAHVQSLASANKTRFHLPDGTAQRERDAKMAAGGTDWSHQAIGWLFDYDALAAAETGGAGLPAA